MAFAYGALFNGYTGTKSMVSEVFVTAFGMLSLSFTIASCMGDGLHRESVSVGGYACSRVEMRDRESACRYGKEMCRHSVSLRSL